MLLAPRFWGAHLLALVCFAVAGWLGYWQYDGWQAAREAAAMDLTEEPAVPLDEAFDPDEPFPGRLVGQPVQIEGTWLPGSTVFVSGRASAGRDGYWVVTALTHGGPADPAIPVVRGWSERPEAPEPPAGEGAVVGWLQPGEGTGQMDDDRSDDVIPQMRLADLVQYVDQDLYGGYAVLDQEAPATNPGTEGLEPATLTQLPEGDRFTGLRNLLYAVEWWIFGAFAAFIWWRYVREVTGRRDPEGPAEEDASPDPVLS